MPPCQRRMVPGYVADFIPPSVPGNAGANSDWEHLQDLEAFYRAAPRNSNQPVMHSGQASSSF